jgi:hypothetical protein
MTEADLAAVRSDLLHDKGCILVPDDSGMIGVGRPLSRGITQPEAMRLLDADLAACVSAALVFPWFLELDAVRRRAVINRWFDSAAGWPVPRQFLSAMACRDYRRAAMALLHTAWADAHKGRAMRIIRAIETGVE